MDHHNNGWGIIFFSLQHFCFVNQFLQSLTWEDYSKEVACIRFDIVTYSQYCIAHNLLTSNKPRSADSRLPLEIRYLEFYARVTMITIIKIWKYLSQFAIGMWKDELKKVKELNITHEFLYGLALWSECLCQLYSH